MQPKNMLNLFVEVEEEREYLLAMVLLLKKNANNILEVYRICGLLQKRLEQKL